MASFSFIHTADIHLDSPLRGLGGMEGPAVERIRTATRKAFANLITEAVEREVDFVVIAGDLYDGDWRDYQTGLFFVAQMEKVIWHCLAAHRQMNSASRTQNSSLSLLRCATR